MTDGALEHLESHGRKRLLPHLAQLPIGEITERDVRSWMAPFDPEVSERLPSAAKLAEARGYLSMRFPSLADTPSIGSRVCCYSSTADQEFIVDRVPGFRVNGSWATTRATASSTRRLWPSISSVSSTDARP